MKNRWEASGIEEKLDMISWLEKGEQVVDTYHMLDSLIVAYVRVMKMLIELKKVLSV
jgi:hypothetical protein